MNVKRIAAICGLIGMAVCILCIIVSGAVPALKDLLWTIGLISFLIAASIALIIHIRAQQAKDSEEAGQEDK